MKRHIQKTGVRKFFGQDFVDLQAEPLKALDAFFAAYGACLIEGCAITEADGGTFNVAPGLVALESTDPESGVVSVRTMPFAGAKGVALPLYLVAEWTVVERAYGDGKVKPIGYNLLAVASGVVPEGPHLTLTDAGGNRFVDALQDPAHRFVSDLERSKWNDILRQAKEYAQTQAASSQATAVGLAKAHTDGQVAAVRNEMAVGDQAALNTAKAYADWIVAALVDNSPELLNTLEELAAALGNDPNFATTVMTEIGKRATMGEVNTALAAKANTNHGHTASSVGAMAAIPIATRPDPNDWSGPLSALSGGNGAPKYGAPMIAFGSGSYLCQLMLGGASSYENAWNRIFFRSKEGDTSAISDWKEFYHSGNFDPATKAAAKHTHGSGDLSGVMRAIPVDTRPKPDDWGSTLTGLSSGDGAAQFGAPIISFGAEGYLCQIMLGGVNAWKNGCNRLFFRSKDGDTGTVYGWKEIHHSGNLKIIRGSVDAMGGNGGGNAENIYPVHSEPAVVRVTHNLGTTAYSATATAVSKESESHSDNVVTVWRKGTNVVDFVVTQGPGTARELCAFDFIIIAH